MGEGEGTLAMASLEAAELLTAKRFTVYDFQIDASFCTSASDRNAHFVTHVTLKDLTSC